MLLTFDDGPSEWTAPILYLLAEHGHKAVFFVVGQTAARQPELLRLMVRAGHRVGNHTFSHATLPWLPEAEVALELAACSSVIQAACGERPSVWRAPHLMRNEREERIGAALGMEYLSADVRPEDWSRDDPEEIAALVLADFEAGGQVACLHDGVAPDASEHSKPGRAATVEAVRLILEALR